MQDSKPFFNPLFIIVLGVVCTSFASIFTRLATAPPLVIAFYRLAITVLLISPFLLFGSGREELKSMRGRDLALASLSGAFLAVHFTVWITSLRYTSIASSTVLVTLQPIFVISLGYLFLKEKISTAGGSGGAIALAGSMLIGFGDFRIGGQALLGDLLAFSGAFFVAVYVLIGRSLRSRLSLLPYVFVVYGTAVLFLLLFNLLTGTPLYPYPPRDWLWFFALAVFPTIFGHTVFNWALRYVKAALVSVSILGEPVGATLLGILFFREIPGMIQVLGGLAVISGLTVFLLKENA